MAYPPACQGPCPEWAGEAALGGPGHRPPRLPGHHSQDRRDPSQGPGLSVSSVVVLVIHGFQIAAKMNMDCYKQAFEKDPGKAYTYLPTIPVFQDYPEFSASFPAVFTRFLTFSAIFRLNFTIISKLFLYSIQLISTFV